MSRRIYPNPILDAREESLIAKLQKDFEGFIKPGPVERGLKTITGAVGRLIPQKLKGVFSSAKAAAGNWQLVKQTLDIAAKGFQTLTHHAAKLAVSKPGLVEKLSARGLPISKFPEVCLLRSYDLEAAAEKTWDISLAAVEGAATGAFGFVGLPFNLALSFFLYFRAAQGIALHYGYDVQDDPSELQFAAEVTIQSLDPNFTGSGLAGLIGKMMTAAEVSALKQALGRLSYAEMARQGGSSLLYVQIRAMASQAAKKALKKAKREGLEAGIFKTLLAQMAQRMPKEAGKKAVPILGALIGGCSDAYLMSRILRGAKLIYHKRFLLEKEHRIALLKKPRTPRNASAVAKKPSPISKAPGASKASKPRKSA